MRYEKRLHALEARRGAQAISRSAVIDAMRRIQTRAWPTMARRLYGSDNRAVIAAVLAELADDLPEQVAQDEALVCRWRRVQGRMLDVTGVRARMARRLDQMAERQHATATVAPWVTVHAQTSPRLPGSYALLILLAKSGTSPMKGGMRVYTQCVSRLVLLRN
jgi:hypothetical protein